MNGPEALLVQREADPEPDGANSRQGEAIGCAQAPVGGAERAGRVIGIRVLTSVRASAVRRGVRSKQPTITSRRNHEGSA